MCVQRSRAGNYKNKIYSLVKKAEIIQDAVLDRRQQKSGANRLKQVGETTDIQSGARPIRVRFVECKQHKTTYSVIAFFLQSDNMHFVFFPTEYFLNVL